jgi:hypothetical protein
MKGFIKIKDINQVEQFINIDYVIKFGGLNEDYEGKSILYIKFGEKVSTLQSESTVDEIIELINSAGK